MKLSIDLIRYILLEIESSEKMFLDKINLPTQFPQEMCVYHCFLLKEKQFINFHSVYNPWDIPQESQNLSYFTYILDNKTLEVKFNNLHLTSLGYDFLSVLKPDKLFFRAKDIFKNSNIADSINNYEAVLNSLMWAELTNRELNGINSIPKNQFGNA